MIELVEPHEQGIYERIRRRGRRGRTRRACRSQKLHHTERLATTQRRAPVSAYQGTAGGHEGRGLGGGQRRSQRKRRLSVRQTAAATDRSADSFSHETNRCRGSGGSRSPERWASGDARLLWGDRAL